MLRSRCWTAVGSVENSVVGAWSCSRIALCGLSSSSARMGENWPSSSEVLFAGVDAGAADLMSSSHSARSFFNLRILRQYSKHSISSANNDPPLELLFKLLGLCSVCDVPWIRFLPQRQLRRIAFITGKPIAE